MRHGVEVGNGRGVRGSEVEEIQEHRERVAVRKRCEVKWGYCQMIE